MRKPKNDPFRPDPEDEDDLFLSDPLAWRKRAEAELVEERGREWVDRHKGLLDAQFDYLLRLEGIDPASLPSPAES